MAYILAAISLVLLFILYRALPNRKLFWCFFLLLLVSGTAVYINDSRSGEQRAMSESERSALWAAQQNFAAWYADYQKDIEEMDRNWQFYHDSVTEFQNGDIDESVLHERLISLEEDTKATADKIAGLTPPAGMSGECNALIGTLITKTHTYAAAQHKTVALSRSTLAATTTTGATDYQRALRDVIIRQAPAGLFTAKEIAAIREHLTVPE